MEPTDHNLRAWDEVHRRRGERIAGHLVLPSPVRHALADLHGEHPAAKCIDGLMHWRESYFDDREIVRLGRIVTAIVRGGLTVRALEEYPQQPGNYRHHDARVPGTFLLHARRP